MFQIPLTTTTLGEEEAQAAAQVVRSGWVTMGQEVQAFEAEFAAALGTRHAVAVSNGTAALEIAYRAAGLGPGDEVLLPAITFVACLNAARLVGATPVLVDVTSETDWTISIADLRRKLTPRSKVVVPMAHGGYPPDMEALMQLAAERGFRVVEDACHAPLASLGGRKLGGFGLAGTWSFFGNKNMTTGEGGMITTNDDAVAAHCRLLRSHGITRPTWDRAQGHAFDYDVAETGTNARLDEVRAAIGRVQLRRLPAHTRARASAFSDLAMRIGSIPQLQIPHQAPRGERVHHLFSVLLPANCSRLAVMTSLKERGVQTSIHYPPLDGFTSTAEMHDDALVVTRSVAPRILTLPLGPAQTAEQNEYVADALRKALEA